MYSGITSGRPIGLYGMMEIKFWVSCIKAGARMLALYVLTQVQPLAPHMDSSTKCARSDYGVQKQE